MAVCSRGRNSMTSWWIIPATILGTAAWAVVIATLIGVFT